MLSSARRVKSLHWEGLRRISALRFRGAWRYLGHARGAAWLSGGWSAMHADSGLLEREAVTTSVAHLVARVSTGGAGALFLVGEAGLGKTSVIDQAWRGAVGSNLTVGLGRGHPMETGLPFGVLTQAFDGVGGRGLLGWDETDSGSAANWADRYYRVLRWLQVRVGSPVFLGIDDLHWADADSVALMSFLCRRMDGVGFGLVASMRPWPAAAREAVAGLVEDGHGVVFRLLPLSQPAAGALLEARVGRRVPVAVRRRALDLCAGNPLLLEQLAMGMGKGADVPDAAGVGMAAFGQDVLLSRFAGLPPAACVVLRPRRCWGHPSGPRLPPR